MVQLRKILTKRIPYQYRDVEIMHSANRLALHNTAITFFRFIVINGDSAVKYTLLSDGRYPRMGFLYSILLLMGLEYVRDNFSIYSATCRVIVPFISEWILTALD